MTEFETLTAAHIEQYRPPTGYLTHPDSVGVSDPHNTLTPDRVAAQAVVSRGRRAPSIVGAATILIAIGEVTVMLTLGPASVVVLAGTLVVMLVVMFGVGLIAMLSDKHYTRMIKAAEPCSLSVPADVGAAYAAYRQTPAQLRTASAGEDVAAVVEARMGHMEDLLVEAARLHALDADATEDGLAVREQMITHAAKAQSLLVMAQRKAVAIADADAGTALVLGRGADDTAFEDAGAQLAEETEFVREVLNGTHILSHVIPSPASAPILVAETEKETLR